MPLYEYECKQCHQRVEKIQSFSAPPEKICPQCGGELERVISAPALQFKGAGWYVNDYAKSGSKAAAAAKNGGDGKAENKSESASESKSAGASEAKSSADSAPASTGSGSSPSDTSSSAGSSSAGKTTPASS